MFDSKFLTRIASMWTDLTARTKALETSTGQLSTTASQLSTDTTNLKKTTDGLLLNRVYSFTVVTTSDGTVVVDYTTLGLTKSPKVVGIAKLNAVGDVPVFVSLIGEPTKAKATLSVRRMTSILSLGLVPQYGGISGISIDVYIRPVE